MGAREYAVPVIVGGVFGGGAALVTWHFASQALDKQLAEGGKGLLASAERELRAEIRQTVNAEVPPLVRAEMDQKLREYGISRATGRQIATVLSYADRIGLLGLPQPAKLAQLDERTNTWVLLGAGAVLLSAVGIMVAAGLAEPKRSR